MSGFAQVTLKLATSLDGKIALANGLSQWITGPEARDAVHALRARHDAVLTGIGTVLADDPRLTVRPGGKKASTQPLRAVMDSRLRTPVTAKLLEEGPVTFFHTADDTSRTETLAKAGGSPVRLNANSDGRASLKEAIRYLASAGAGRILLEAGGTLAGAALRQGLVHRIEWFRAPMIIGGDGMDVFSALGLASLEAAPQFRRVSLRVLGRDIHESYEREGN